MAIPHKNEEKTEEGSGAWSDGCWNKGTGVTIDSTSSSGSDSGSGSGSRSGGSGHPDRSGGGSDGTCRGRGMLWKPISEKKGLVCLFSCKKAPGGVQVNGLEMVYHGQHNGNRAHYRPPNVAQPGATFGNNVKVTGYGNTWIIPVGANRWQGGPKTTAKPASTTNPGNDDTNDDTDVVNTGGRTKYKFHHWNWNAWRIGAGTAMVSTKSTNGCEWVEVAGHRMAMAGRRRDDGRDVWTAGSFKGNKTLSGRVKFKGKVYTFKIPRRPDVVYSINFWGSKKPTSKPTSSGDDQGNTR
tara:strand:+ start:78 stop:965 length:888 start_codon:yes stop_codon:yes gene_type:complete